MANVNSNRNVPKMAEALQKLFYNMQTAVEACELYFVFIEMKYM
jgi:hypothetical protein